MSFRSAPRLLCAQQGVLLGGQAVLEGVMMRAPAGFAVAVRRPDGEIVWRAERRALWSARPLLRAPLLRGVTTLVQSLALGVSALNFSAEQAFPEATPRRRSRSGALATLSAAVTVSVALTLAAALFFVLPLGLTELIRRSRPELTGGVAYAAVDGALRGIILLGYIVALRGSRDIRRLFRYHGAEHKVVHAFEAGGPMAVPEVQRFSVLHPRCGTSFLLFVVVVSIGVFSLIPSGWPAAAKVAARLALAPLVAGAAYEALRWSARRRGLLRALAAPGLWLQRLTTAPPDDRMVEVALAAFERAAALPRNGAELVL